MLSKAQLLQLKKTLLGFTSPLSLPKEDALIEVGEKACTVLSSEKTSYRKPASDGTCGGLLDFTGQKISAVLVPDLHARYDFLISLLDFVPSFSKKNILELLNESEVIVVCVGDALHSERRGKLRWLESLKYYDAGDTVSPPMQEEMKENLAVLQIIMTLKSAFPENFHFLKGNHENILNEYADGNFPFFKYAAEGQMTKDFICDYYSEALLHVISSWEKSLPLCAAFKTFCVSHAEPFKFYKKKQIINYHDDEDVTVGLTWTKNDEACEKSVARTFHELTGQPEEKALWFSGHRPVEGTFFFRQEMSLIQFHNPNEMNVAVVSCDNSFTPYKDIVSVRRKI